MCHFLTYCLWTPHSPFVSRNWNSTNYIFSSLADFLLGSTTSSRYLKRLEGRRKKALSPPLLAICTSTALAVGFQSPAFLSDMHRHNQLISPLRSTGTSSVKPLLWTLRFWKPQPLPFVSPLWMSFFAFLIFQHLTNSLY